MQYKNYTDPIINNYRRDEQGAKQAKQISGEQHKVVNGKVALSELPDEEQVLSIEGYNETKDWNTELKDKQFRVDYTNGFIYFSPTQDGQSVSVNYFGLGVTYFPASRVWLEVDGENNVKKTLGDVQGDIEEAKKLSENQEQLKKDLDEQGGKLKDMVNEIQRVDLTEIENSVSNAKQAENSLKATTNEAEAKIANVNETKKQLDTSIQSAKDEGKSLDSKIEQSKVNKADIDSACEKLNQAKGSVDGAVKQANDSIAAIDEKVNTGNQVKSELDNSIQQANDVNSTLSNTKQEATQTNSELIASQKTADKTKADLEALKSESTSLSTDLGDKNTEAKQNIDSLTSQNSQAKDNITGLQNESKTAIENKETLLSENTKVSQNISQIETLIQSSTDLKNKLEEIIASGDLGKYVTDPKLQNILVSYATKDDLNKVDLTEQLKEYAKITDVPELGNIAFYGVENAPFFHFFNMKYDPDSGFTNIIEEVKDDKLRELLDSGKTVYLHLTGKSLEAKNGFEGFYGYLLRGRNIVGEITSSSNRFFSSVNDIKNKDLGHSLQSISWNTLVSYNKQVQEEFKELESSKVDKVYGYGLSKNDYSDIDKSKVDAIPDNPKYTDTVPDLSGYATKSSIPTSLSQLTDDETHRLVTDEEKTKWNSGAGVDLSGYATKSSVPTSLSQLSEDSAHRVVSDTEKAKWNNKVDKVQGKQLSTNDFTDSFKLAIGTLQNTALTVSKPQSDLNSVTKAGFYSCRSGSNFPPGAGSYGTLIVSKADNTVDNSQTDTVQLYIDQNNNVFIRNSIDKTNAWTSWTQLGGHATKILTESEYNGLSTKDADTLYFIK